MRLSQVKTQHDTQDLLHQFKEWRANRVRGQQIPKELWRQAVLLANKYPPSHVANAMGLSPKQLEKHIKSATGEDTKQVDFVRVAPVQISGPNNPPQKPQVNSLVAEITTANGTHLRIFSGIDERSMQALSGLLLEGL